MNQIKKRPHFSVGPFKSSLSGQCAYLAGPCGPTTSAAEELNCRVRYGNGCFLLAMTTRIEIEQRERA